MTIPVTAEPRADLSRSSESCVLELLSGLEQHIQISSGALGFLSQLPPPVPCTTDAFHELHQVTAEVPQPAPSLQMSLCMWKQTLHNI